MDNRPSPQELISAYLMAFRICNQGVKEPTIVYDRGWFKFTDWAGRNYRRDAFFEMLETLRQRANTGRDSVISAAALANSSGVGK